MVSRMLIDKISRKFSDTIEKEIYPLLVDFLKRRFGDKMNVEKNRPLILKITAFLENEKPYLGYSGSDADVIMYPRQEAVGIRSDDPLLRKSGQYAMRDPGVIYPSVIIQVITSTKTGKLHQENMKAQAWRSIFPRSLLVLLAGAYRDKYDIRFDRDTTYFDVVLSDLSDLKSCTKNLEVMCDMIGAHLSAKW